MHAIGIEDPSGRALVAFHEALERTQTGGQARVVVYGASHTASDAFTGVLRRRLQARFGEAGAGLVLPGKPWRYYRHAGIDFELSRGFRAFRIRARAPEGGIYGVAGVALDTRADKPARSVFATRGGGGLTGHASRAELYYLKQPGGGHLQLFIDGKRAQRIPTDAKGPVTAYAAFELPDGPHQFDLRAEGDGRVRLFGLALERSVPGVILDTLGVPGTRARDHLYWDDGVYREHLQRRDPDLVVLAYGTNEVGDDDVSPEVYGERLERVLARLQDAVPEASCLLIGPSDRPVRNDDGTFSPRPLTSAIIAEQRRAAERHGCGFFDLQAFMGGELAMVKWVTAVPPLGSPDHVHFTMAGYQQLGEVLYESLLEGFAGAETVVAHSPVSPRPKSAR